ncbi:hypothetical protein GCM10022297_02050 [Lactobacillus hamsteri]|uniref:Surface layer protein A domain-containing protein n=1 Tax=Lactobacillus hamsteri DSM 5661 = JCM 6256 TaxID=1423754 RepID=A0A0R1Y661_9LACO|nr:hypothetical protein [Lactobacillus hamsteri]KRM37918.1 hypothetical protein FC39_GL001492 [Lactobacillus hamsteri DSM 5661 = JCM 6256]
MRKNKLFTALAAVALLTGTGVEVLSNAPVAQAATKKTTKKAKKSKKSKKTSKYATISIKAGAPAYKVTIKNNKVSKVSRLTKKGKKLSLRGGQSPAIWSTKYKKVTYYYIGGNYAVRAKDARCISKKKVPTLNSIIKKAQAKQKAKIDAANDTLKAKVNNWQAQLENVKPKTYAAKTSSEAQYWTIDDNGKLNQNSSKLPSGTQVAVIFKTNDILTNNNGSVTAYFATINNNQRIIISADNVTLDDQGAQIPDQKAYEASVKNFNDMNTQAKNDIEQTKADLENQLKNN